MRIDYLTAVNDVLIRLRERPVTTVNESQYSAMIGTYINDAKQYVENAWDWSSLRETIHVDTIPGTFRYSLVGIDERSTLIDMLNFTSGNFMRFRGTHWFQRQLALTEPDVQGSPIYYGPNGLDEFGWTRLDVFPVPDDVYELKVNLVYRRDDLQADDGILRIPHRPVVLRAYSMALSERGEQGGISAQEALAMAEQALGDAIGLDAHRHPEELQAQVP